MEKRFKLISDFQPKGDQPKAIGKLVADFQTGKQFQTLLGVTGSGKTFTVANVIEQLRMPVLVISHNKTLAAQLYSEFREFFPENRVEYFVSYYDYYQPEAYIPQKDIYIEKDASINEALDRLRLCATNAVLSRRDVIIVASVSCIYNIGSPEEYSRVTVSIEEGQHVNRDSILRKLVNIQYERNDLELRRGKFRVRGDSVELFPSYQDKAIKISFCQDVIESIEETHPVTLETIAKHEYLEIYPAKHFMMSEDRIAAAIISIKEELDERVAELEKQGKLVEAHRLKTRTLYDIEMLTEIGYCKGIENYSRHLSGRPPGARPYCLLDYFPKEFLVIVDESHVTVPQVRGMYNGDRSRKETLVEHGFRLPSALDNRPLRFDEWEELVKRAIFVSATPEQYEIAKSGNEVVEQIIRPTGLIDPKVTVQQTTNQIKHLTEMIRKRMERKERVLVTTLTKRLAEDLSEHLEDENIPCTYLHSEIDTIERVDILRSLREGNFDVLVGVNLLREGLDLPEVSLVAILDADKEGFLRSETALVQTIGRTARNVNGEVILYADTITGSMKRAIAETDRRRKIQMAYNKKHNITPATIKKGIYRGIEETINANKIAKEALSLSDENFGKIESVRELQRQMYEAAAILDFEHAAKIRDEILRLRGVAPEQPATAVQKGRFARFHRKRRRV